MIKWVGIIILFALLVGSASGATLTVNASGGADYTRIQDAVDNASAWDTILVQSGTYYENVYVSKSLNLVGAGPEVTIINASYPNIAVFSIASNNVNISGFTATGGWNGFFVNYGINYANISNNIANLNHYGIFLGNSSSNTLKNNILNSNSYYGIFLGSSSNYNTLINNTANYNDGFGIDVVLSTGNTIMGNTLSYNNRDGIYLGSSNDNNLLNNIALSNNGSGIWLDNSSNSNILTNNTANSNKRFGLEVNYSSNNTITGNILIYGAQAGMHFVYSNYNNITGNNANYNDRMGIRLYASSYNTVSNNIFSNNSINGILVSDFSDNNTITGNNVSNNILRGISLNKSSINNLIYNNFFNNTNNFYSDGTNQYNIWNASKSTGTNIIGGPYLGGNFWANPSSTGFSQTCADANRDGICDTNYTLNAQNIDYLPLSLNFTTTIPSASTIGYSALVATGQNTFVQSSSGAFGLLLKGQFKIINNSVVLNNTGDISAKVEARFNDNSGGVFGLVSGANVLNATNFALGLPGALIPLSKLGADVQVAVAPPGVTALDARLGVPGEQVAGDYSGTVILTFSNSV